MNIQHCTKYGRRMLLAAVLVAAMLPRATAQKDHEKIKELLLRMQHAYQQASYLDFRIAYYYANQSLPDKPLDSLLGKVQMDKNRCRLVIDNTELLVTNNYTIQVMRQEKTIYLSKARHSAMIDPVGLLDSVLAHMGNIKAEVRQKDGTQILAIRFPPGQPYTGVTMTIDEKTGFLQRVTYEMHASTLLSQDMIDRPGHTGLYQAEGQVDVIFSAYRTGSFGETLFDESRFVRKVDDKFEPSERFKDYHILLASTNL